MATERILITGASGTIGRMLRERLRAPGRTLRLLDKVAPPEGGPGEDVEPMAGSVTDTALLTEACRDVDAVLHLAALPVENTWERILAVNVDGTRALLEAARGAGVPRVVLASSNHAAGFHPATGTDLPAEAAPRPDTYYGFSKAATEALGSLYHSRYGMDVLCLRIGAYGDRPDDERGLSIWLSPEDGGRLFEACLSTPSPGFRVVWGVSANTRRLVSRAEGEAIGYHPRDDAEVFADQVRFFPPGTERDFLGGTFTTAALGEPM
ncbi:NAD-dependent epimerase/dehydratase family protein [Saccharopolyspora sp. CA-218241]|uniref:NAD-dependent epimerase/dehydratase family protein n=1 Tax=Saccharopolyspora sp. CA-218241 TaxID=3240027 RepID=UPI003D997112